jgi:TubC N-terminal docking domain
MSLDVNAFRSHLAQSGIILSVDEGKLKCTAPKGALTPDVLADIRAYKVDILAFLARPLADESPQAGISEDERKTLFRSMRDSVSAFPDGALIPIPLFDGALRDFSKSELITYLGARIKGGDSHTLQWAQSIIELLQRRATPPPAPGNAAPAAPSTPAPNHVCYRCEALGIDGSRWEYDKGAHSWVCSHFAQHDRTRRAPAQSQKEDEPVSAGAQDSQDTQADEMGDKRPKWITVFADVSAGRAIVETGALVTFTPGAQLVDMLAAIDSVTPCNRVYLCGTRPGGSGEDFIEWLRNPAILADYTTDKRGHFLDDKDNPDASVARYVHRSTGRKVDIRTVTAWVGDNPTSPEDARDLLALINRYLCIYFTEHSHVSSTPSTTFRQLWLEGNRIAGKRYESLPEEIRALIHRNSGQGRVQFFSEHSSGKLPGLYYYDGKFMYAALTWGMATGLALHDNENVYAGKAPARYRIRYTVPQEWKHIGLFMTRRDEDTWFYPGIESAGKTFETWADGAELDVCIMHYYTAPAISQNASKDEQKQLQEAAYAQAITTAFTAWRLEIAERLVFTTEGGKPLKTITKKLVDMRAHIERDSRQDAARAYLYDLASAAARSILLFGIGTFNSNPRMKTYLYRADEPAPDGAEDAIRLDKNTWLYKVPETRPDTIMSHPEWSGLIYGRCRARMTKAALSIPYEQLIAIRTDAIALTHDIPAWDNPAAKIGQLRLKWAERKAIKAGSLVTDEQLDALQDKALKALGKRK